MARPDPPSSPGRLAAVLGGPDAPRAGESVPLAPFLPGGVWPPQRPGEPAEPGWVDGPPTVPLPLPAADASGEGGGRWGPLLRRVLPAGWRGARVDPGRPGATALALVAATAAVVAAVGVWSERPRAEPVGGLPAVAVVAEPGAEPPAAAGPAPGAASPPGAPLVVSVSGRVARPGLVEVPDGARVADVVAAAGGALPGTDLAGLNLARRVSDGEQVAVGVPPAPDASSSGSSAAAGGSANARSAGKVDLNAAGLEQLDALPGVGPVTAQRILEWRARHGRFTRVEQLREVEGIGERRFGQLRELVTV